MSKIGRTTVVLVTGARWHPDPTIVTNELARYVLIEAPGWVIVRHGACPGEHSIDQAVSEWAKDCEALGVIEDPMPADWDRCHAECPTYRNHRIKKAPDDIYHPGKRPDYCTYAGPRRNGEMITKTPAPDLVIAGPYGYSNGTRNCVSQARQAGIPDRVITVPKTQPKAVAEALF